MLVPPGVSKPRAVYLGSPIVSSDEDRPSIDTPTTELVAPLQSAPIREIIVWDGIFFGRPGS